MDIIKLAIRNIFRNKRRSILTALSLSVAGFVIVALHGYIKGVLNTSRDMVIKLDTGHVLITTEGYFERRIFLPQDEYMGDTEEIENTLKNSKYVEFYTGRIKAGGMIFTKSGTNKNVMIMGIEPEKEKNNIQIQEKSVIDGTYDLSKGCVVGRDLAKSLKLKAGDTLIILSRSVVGGVSAIKIPIAGIVRLGYTTFDKNLLLLSLEDARKLLKTTSGYHEILVFLKSEKYISSFLKSLKLPEGTVANSYTFVLGTFAFFYKFADIFYMGIYILITLLAAFAIVNTMTVAVFERMREIGTLKSIGMTDQEIFNLFGMEGTLIGAAGGFVGTLCGLLFNFILKIKGMNFEDMIKTFDFPFPYVVRPSTNIGIVILAFGLVTIISFATSVLPAMQAKKLTPQEALRQI
ncbi:MAG: FtsX-like permease family protein [candidate division WOR-3 bacterium]